MALPPAPERRELHGIHLHHLPAPINYDRSIFSRVQALWTLFITIPCSVWSVKYGKNAGMPNPRDVELLNQINQKRLARAG